MAANRSGTRGRFAKQRVVATRRLPEATLATGARQLSAAMVVVGLIGAVPLLMAWPGAARAAEGAFPAWGVLLALVTWMHGAYAIYLAQIPHPRSLLVTTVFLLAVTSAYAMLAAVRMLVADRHAWMRFLQMDVNAFSPGQEAGWCFLMVILTGLIAYYAGRTAFFWKWVMAEEQQALGGRDTP